MVSSGRQTRWTAIARKKHPSADRHYDWVQLEGAPMSIDEAKMKYDLGLVEMAQKREENQTLLMVTQRLERSPTRNFFNYSTHFPYQRSL